MTRIKILTLSATLTLANASLSGTVTLESPKFENVCKVQVTTGLNTSGQVVKTYSDVKKGFTVSGNDRLCYRRSAKPNECNSQYSEWKCNTNKGSGTSIIKLS